MSATEQLKAEHEGIKLMLSILLKIYEKLKSTQELNQEHFIRILEFLKVFVDKCHHGKEEDFLLPAMIEGGVPKDKDVITFTLLEHKEGRGYVLDMSKAFNKLKKGNRQASAKILETVKKYITLLIQHIDKEEKMLFSLADKVLSPAKQEELEKAFEKLEIERIGSGKHEEFHKLLHQLKEIYLN